MSTQGSKIKFRLKQQPFKDQKKRIDVLSNMINGYPYDMVITNNNTKNDNKSYSLIDFICNCFNSMSNFLERFKQKVIVKAFR